MVGRQACFYAQKIQVGILTSNKVEYLSCGHLVDTTQACEPSIGVVLVFQIRF